MELVQRESEILTFWTHLWSIIQSTTLWMYIWLCTGEKQTLPPQFKHFCQGKWCLTDKYDLHLNSLSKNIKLVSHLSSSVCYRSENDLNITVLWRSVISLRDVIVSAWITNWKSDSLLTFNQIMIQTDQHQTWFWKMTGFILHQLLKASCF